MRILIEAFRFYGLLGFIRLFLDVLYTRLFCSRARLVRRPVYIRSRAQYRWGINMTVGVGLRVDLVDSSAELTFGKNVQINDYCHIGVLDRVTVGDETIIGSKVLITDHSHGRIFSPCEESAPWTPPIARPLEAAAVDIGGYCWIGEGVNILPGSKIGDGCIVAAGSVVSGSFPGSVMIKGNPARVFAVYNKSLKVWELL